MRQIQHILRQASCLDDAPDLDRTLIFNQRADRVEQLGAELGVPAVLPRDEPDDSRYRLARVLLLLHVRQDASQRFGREADAETGAVGFDGFVLVVQALSEGAEDLPLFGGLLVLHLLGTVLGHFGAPDGVDAKILVENHEEAVEPALAEAFVIEAR